MTNIRHHGDASVCAGTDAGADTGIVDLHHLHVPASSSLPNPVPEHLPQPSPQSLLSKPPSGRKRSGNISPLWGTSLFFAYLAVFLALPTLIIAISAFQSADNTATLSNFSVLIEANTLRAFETSLVVSAISATIGAAVGALAANSLATLSVSHPLLRRVVTSLCSVLSQFGGVMLAFAFIATFGITGILTVTFAELFGIAPDSSWLSTVPGLILVYCYFQIPLMVIVFLPALDGIKPQWREATEVYGGNGWTYWTRVAGPLLWPAFLGSWILLFANAFSSFATAAALFTQQQILIPLMIQAKMSNELDLTQTGAASVLALMMIVVVAIAMGLNWLLSTRSARWEK
ncbi:MAG: ABC transporter permease subunit [Actinomycetaceae bacterium]|nr:ABC transporter permease subunit [Arcanobacterium sp.]MDD7686631.1 ABC transporter permease subunit [Actinomycetaceae bacterium]MDY5273861.1 ABC transporter permease subunit [Arcanobacterium sp.]